MTWERSPVIDEYAEAGDPRRAVLVDGQVVVASELATAILDVLPADEATIAGRLVELFGPPPGGLEQAVRAALEEVARVGLIHSKAMEG